VDLNERLLEGVRLWKQGRNAEALAAFQGLAAQVPAHFGVRYHLGLALKDLGRHHEAEGAFHAAAMLDPLRPEPHIALANLRREQGRVPEAILGYRRALALDPKSAAAQQNLALLLHYDPRADGPALRRAAEAWARLVEARTPPASLPPQDPDPGRRLRVGFLSPDFRRHSCAFFLEPLLEHLDPDRVEACAYADVWDPDATTTRFEALCPRFVNVSRVPDEDLASRLREDRLDVLVDLAGHTGNNRLGLFARRLAPVQATWLGCPGTTGLASMDARLTDSLADPPGSSEAHHTEALVRLDPVFLCFRPSPEAPAVSPPPSAAGGPFTFGCFNALAKLSDGALALWAEILRATPGARLLLKDRALADPAQQAGVRSRFAAAGIPGDRLACLGWTATDADHYAAYAQVDVALDPFPYNGTTTTCEALWMGVPVVALAGDRHAGRVGASLLRAVGLPDLVAPDPAAYRGIATALAGDRDRLAALRAGLRERMAASPLCDGPAFARRFEAALRGMWRQACERAESKP
jgi:predicted O-linked N-acetylglucosamine transferase (SPINDLY family)